MDSIEGQVRMWHFYLGWSTVSQKIQHILLDLYTTNHKNADFWLLGKVTYVEFSIIEYSNRAKSARHEVYFR